jgi:outer membrane protein assembly factor BamA
MKVRERGLFSKGVFSPELLEQDRLNLLAMYQRAGFEGTEITTQSREEKNHVINISVSIKEGQQLPIEILTFEGNLAVTEAEIRERSGI